MIGEEVGIDPYAPKLRIRLPGGALQRLLAPVVADLLHFLGGLPEEKIRADRGAQHGRQGSQVFLLELKVRVARATFPQETWTKRITPTYANRERVSHFRYFT